MPARIKPIHAILETADRHALRRSLGPFSLMLLGIGTIIGTGIFVLTAEAAQKAGPAMIVSFCIAGLVCTFAALCYAEMAAMVPVSGSAYTYSYAVVGELLAWSVGWALILEYAIASGAVAVGWSGYFVGLLRELLGVNLPAALTLGPLEGGFVNLPAALLVLLLMGLLLIGTRESARFNAALVVVKISALTLFCVLALPVLSARGFHPFAPTGLGGISDAAASIFFAYVGFDAVATAAEETRNPQRNLPIGLIGSLFVCTVFYVLVAVGMIGTVGAQPLLDVAGRAMIPGSTALADACRQQQVAVLVCSKEALAWALRSIGWQQVGNLMGLVAGFALPSVVLMTMFGQSRQLRDQPLFLRPLDANQAPLPLRGPAGCAADDLDSLVGHGDYHLFYNANCWSSAILSIALRTMDSRGADPEFVRKCAQQGTFLSSYADKILLLSRQGRRPAQFFPCAFARANPDWVRSMRRSRSNSASLSNWTTNGLMRS